MIKKIEKPRIAVLGISLPFYDKAFPGYMERLGNQLKKFQAQFDSFAQIAASRLCYEREHLQMEIKKAEELGVDALVLIPMSYTASLMTLEPVLKTALPLILWNTQEMPEMGDAYNFDDLLMNHIIQGTQDVTNVLIRSGRVFGMESGHYQDKKALQRLAGWLQAARAFRFAKNLRVGLLGSPYQDMGDFGVDETRMLGKWGPYVVKLSLPHFVKLIAQVDENKVSKLLAEDRKKYDVSDKISEEIHRLSLRLELALRQLIADDGNEGLDAFTMNFRALMEDGRIPTIPFLGINKLLAEGMGTGGEGDIMCAAHMAQMRALAGTANFTEMYTADYVHNRMLMTHMQECNPALARKDRKVKLVPKDFWAPGTSPYVGMYFTLEPGPVTLTAITLDKDANFYYISYETMIRDMEPLVNFDIPHWMVELDEPVANFLNRYSLAGGPHHLVSVPGRCNELLAKLAHLQGFDIKKL